MIPIETERKFLLKHIPIKLGIGTKIVQGYINEKGTTVRVRIADDKAFLTLKGKPTVGKLGKPEFEYPIPVEHAQFMLDTMCGTRVIHKVRYTIGFANYIYEVDVFGGALKGMVVAELEYPESANEIMMNHPKPNWLGREVTDDKQYTNKRLAKTQVIPSNYEWPQ